MESVTYVGRYVRELDRFLRIGPKLKNFKYNRNIPLLLCHICVHSMVSIWGALSTKMTEKEKARFF